MRVLVSVGTTAFSELIAIVDSKIPDGWTATAQIADGDYEPSNMSWFRYKDSLAEDYEQADIIISHAGAGTVYQCLELNKRLIIVPNLNRSDKHQIELARYIDRHNYALVCYDLSEMSDYINKASEYIPEKYQPEPFNGIRDIRKTIGLDN